MKTHPLQTIKCPYNKNGMKVYTDFFINELKLQDHLESFTVEQGKILNTNIYTKQLIRSFEVILDFFDGDIKEAVSFVMCGPANNIFIEKLNLQESDNFYNFTVSFLKEADFYYTHKDGFAQAKNFLEK